MVFNTPFNNISAISWRTVLLEETGVPRENHHPVASHWRTLSHNVVSSTHRHGKNRFEDTKGLIRSCNSKKNRQCNVQKKRTKVQIIFFKILYRKLLIEQTCSSNSYSFLLEIISCCLHIIWCLIVSRLSYTYSNLVLCLLNFVCFMVFNTPFNNISVIS
jgi:hypothetical protein